VTLKKYNSVQYDTPVENKKEEPYEFIHYPLKDTLFFSSRRKRMSVIVLEKKADVETDEY
jgi:magnesium-transporting ATPase (P-type)